MTRGFCHWCVGVLSGVMCGACVPFPDLPSRPFDAFVQCRPDDVEPLLTLDEAIALVDEDGDGALTEADLRVGETVVILEITGVHLWSGIRSQSGFTVHSSWKASFATPTRFEVATWLVDLHAASCLPVLNVLVGFADEGKPPGTPAQVGAYEVRGLGVDVETHEVTSMGDSEIDARITVTEAGAERVSGHVEGFARTVLYAWIPEIRATGQQVALHALAFRGIVDERAYLAGRN